MSDYQVVFDTVRPWLDGEGYTPARISALNAACALLKGEIVVTAPRAATPAPAVTTGLTPRIVCELLAHEGVVLEAYKDSVGVWTWSVGLATTGGWPVMQYKDNPASLEVCLAAYLKALRTVYLPAVLKAFPGRLEEHQLGALLSFHYNTGAIGRLGPNEMDFMRWRRPAAIVKRRECERDLYRQARWSSDGTALVYQAVAKPAYRPISPKRVPVRQLVEELLK